MSRRAPETPRVLMLGVDGLDWNLLHPLLDAGRLPHLARLVDRGTIATLGVGQPLLAPSLWTTVATDQPPHQHGVLHDRVPDPADSSGQRDLPAEVAARRSPALWEIAARAGLRVHVVGWPATFPAERTTAVFLTRLLLVSTRGFLTGSSRPAPAPGEQAVAADLHRPQGLAVLWGPGIRQDERLDGAGLRDIAPTALGLLGLPAAARLPSRIWSEVFEDGPPLRPPLIVCQSDSPKCAEDLPPRPDLVAWSATLLAAHHPSGAR